jgi:beta-N-acetylhexosaminidase
MSHSRRVTGPGVLLAAAVVLLLSGCGSTADPSLGGPDDSTPAGAGGNEAAGATTTTVDPALACIARMPVRQRAAQTLAIAVDGGALGTEAPRIAELGVGAVILQRPAASGLTEGITQLKAASAIAPLVMVDEEGGESQVLRDVVGSLPSEPTIAAAGDPAAAQVEVAAHAQAIAALGVDVVLGPVVDVTTPGGGGPLAARAFSDDPAQVATFGAAYRDAYLAAGLIPVFKHFPGHGAASGDSHDGPVSVPGIDALRARDLLPYEQLLGEPGVGVMVAHVVVPDLTGLTASSQSAELVQGVLRDEMGFGGLVLTDSLSMGAIAFRTPPEVSFPAAIAAGADLALFVSIADPAAAITAMEQAVVAGTVPEARLDEAVSRVLDAKALDPCTLAPPEG